VTSTVPAARDGRRRTAPTLSPTAVVIGALVIGGTMVAGYVALVLRTLHVDPLDRGFVLPLVFIVSVSLVAFGWLARRHPDEPWLFWLLLIGLGARLIGAYLRYRSLTDAYSGVGDATGYDSYGHDFASAIFLNSATPHLPDLSATNFMRGTTGGLYVVTGPEIYTGFFVYAYAAFWGSYLWYRAAADAVPMLNRRLYLALLLLVPSLAYWPSSISKEAVMMLGTGAFAYAASLLLRRRGFVAFPIGVASALLVNQVRPHLAAMCALALTVAYVFGRVRARDERPGSIHLGRVLCTIALVVGSAVAVVHASDFLRLDSLSPDAVAERLQEQAATTAEGTTFDAPEPSLTVAAIPNGLVTVLFRPFLTEADSTFIALAAVEATAFAVLAIWRWQSILLGLRSLRRYPFLLYALVFLLVFATAFSSFRNLGLLARERSLVLPAFFLFCSIRAPIAARIVPVRRARAVGVT
jgi:hypothetical protein